MIMLYCFDAGLGRRRAVVIINSHDILIDLFYPVT